MKYILFDGYFISYAIYNPSSQIFTHIYNYDKTHMIIWLYIKNILNISNIKLISIDIINLIPINDKKLDSIIIASYFLDKKQKYIIIDNATKNQIHETKNKEIKFIYCTLDYKYILTSEFEKFKDSLISNKYLSCYDIVKMIQLFSYNFYTINNDSILEIMIDSLNDGLLIKSYKEKDVLLIHNG